jgi:uncharacterized membrane protein YesL
MIDRNLKQRAADAYLNAIPLITLNVVWFLTSLPVVTLPAATGGLVYATNRLARGQSATWRTLLEGFRLYWQQSTALGLLNLVMAVIVGVNLFYYSMRPEGWVQAARLVVLTVALIWLMVQVHAYPLLMEQEQPRVTLALRNSFVILIKRPLPGLLTALLIAFIAALSTLIIQPAWIFFTASTCAYLANRTTVSAIAAITGKPVDELEENRTENREPGTE